MRCQGSWRVSINRGTPSWAPDGRSLYLRTNESLYRIDLDMTSGIRTTGTAEHIYTGPPSFSYTVHPKTGRVLIGAPSSPGTGEYRGRIDLVLNWSKTLGLETPGD